jgi:uncharacterized protein (TIGR02271 family)
MKQRNDETLPYRRKEPETEPPEVARPAEGGLDAAERPRLELLEERLVARKREEQIGEVVIRKETEEVPGRLDVETSHDEVEVEHVPVGRVVNQREGNRQEGDVLVVPVYEEQIVAVKRLVLREYVRVRRRRTTEYQVYNDTLRRDRLVVDDPQGTGFVHEVYRGPNGEDLAESRSSSGGGLIDWLKKALS